MPSLALSVLTPDEMVLEQQVDEVTIPGLLGEFGILPGHVALISATRAGVLSYRSGSERGRLAIGPGFAEVDGKGAVVVLAQKALRSNQIDLATAESDEDRAWAQAQADAARS